MIFTAAIDGPQEHVEVKEVAAEGSGIKVESMEIELDPEYMAETLSGECIVAGTASLVMCHALGGGVARWSTRAMSLF